MKRVMSEWLPTVVFELGFVFVTAWLFFDFASVSAVLVIYFVLVFLRRKKEKKQKKRWELNLAFKDALVCLESSLAVGYSPESSFKEAVKGLEQLYGREHELCQGFRQMIKQMELGSSMEQVFLEYGQLSGVEDIRQLAEIFAVVKRTGGNLGSVLRQTGGILQEKIELKRELHTAIAAKRLEFQIMCIVPYGILLYLKLFAPSMSEGLYHNTFGIAFMAGALILYFAMRVLGEWIIRSGIGKLEDGAG